MYPVPNQSCKLYWRDEMPDKGKDLGNTDEETLKCPVKLHFRVN